MTTSSDATTTVDTAGSETTEELAFPVVDPKASLEKAAAGLDYDFERLVAIRKRISWITKTVLPLLPEGVDLPDSSYSYAYGIDLYIPEDPRREWRGVDGTAGLVHRIRKALNIKKLERRVQPVEYNQTVQHTFTGHADLGPDHSMEYVQIRLGNQLPPTCVIQWTEQEVTEKRRVGKVVCG
jgi:hypothetical protein